MLGLLALASGVGRAFQNPHGTVGSTIRVTRCDVGP